MCLRFHDVDRAVEPGLAEIEILSSRLTKGPALTPKPPILPGTFFSTTYVSQMLTWASLTHSPIDHRLL